MFKLNVIQNLPSSSDERVDDAGAASTGEGNERDSAQDIEGDDEHGPTSTETMHTARFGDAMASILGKRVRNDAVRAPCTGDPLDWRSLFAEFVRAWFRRNAEAHLSQTKYGKRRG